jgi:hypothetical protein
LKVEGLKTSKEENGDTKKKENERNTRNNDVIKPNLKRTAKA